MHEFALCGTEGVTLKRFGTNSRGFSLLVLMFVVDLLYFVCHSDDDRQTNSLR